MTHKKNIENWLYSIPPFLLAVDLLIKKQILILFNSNPYPISPSKPVWGDFFRLTYVQNYGITFGIFRDLPKPYNYIVLTSTSLLALGVLFYFYKNISEMVQEKVEIYAKAALLTIFGGALGNIADRFIRGFVVDYLDFGINGYRWYTFNFADTTVVCGCIVLALLMMFFEKKQEKI